VFPAFKGSPTARSAADQTAWNQKVSRAPIDPNSADYVARISDLGGNQVVHPDFGGNGRYGIPYTTVGRGQRRVRVTVTGYSDESDFGLAPIPPNAPIENGSDRHVLVLQRRRCDLFEMFGARYAGGPGHRWRASSTARFDLGSRRPRADGWTPAPLPPWQPVAGDLQGPLPLRVMTADNGGSGSNWFITGASSKRWKDGDLNHLKTVPGTAFAVIDSRAPVRTPC
jgi:hypothetical protein